MTCKICGRYSCMESFHTTEEQQEFSKARDRVVDEIKADIIRKIDKLKGHYHGNNYYIKFADVVKVVDSI